MLLDLLPLEQPLPSQPVGGGGWGRRIYVRKPQTPQPPKTDPAQVQATQRMLRWRQVEQQQETDALLAALHAHDALEEGEWAALLASLT